ncbi:TIM barrel protein [Amnibacterium sp. CER49]|uniref:sugar phosphate isomerase/epimerase family protein n=1 Tax=Amnibacterium sp. CER49 TaxID=3039161 RepID=UPI0024468B62|nr:TIM barrel protein [Amnibacterium sp. CER49]MDH2443481.1 TIM barrel protein [Amnibacterium sp. CER49]
MIGLGSYAFFWRQSDRVPAPMGLVDVLTETRDLGARLFQICDWAPLEAMTERELRDAAAAARDLEVAIELGTRGVAPEHLARFLRLADLFDARLVRTMITGAPPSVPEAGLLLRAALPDYEAAGVALVLETYEQVATADLVGLVEAIGSSALGICLDPANTVARLEHPQDVIERCAAVTRSVHVKDFAFARQPGWVGFVYSGAALGTGLHDYAALRAVVRPAERGINEIVEHWLPWQGDPATTTATEAEWTRVALEHLRSTP